MQSPNALTTSTIFFCAVHPPFISPFRHQPWLEHGESRWNKKPHSKHTHTRAHKHTHRSTLASLPLNKNSHSSSVTPRPLNLQAETYRHGCGETRSSQSSCRARIKSPCWCCCQKPPRAKPAEVFPPHHTAYCLHVCECIRETERERGWEKKAGFKDYNFLPQKRPEMPFLSHDTIMVT